MAKYRQVDTRLWSDRKFLALSDDGRMLWMFLLTAPQTLPIPGVIVGGQAALAEQLGWTVPRLQKGYGELLTKGLAIRFEGRLTWLPNALKYQKISGPNALIGMSKVWDDVPECELKTEIWEALKIACKKWSKLFDKGFAIPLSKPLVEGFDTGTGTGTGTGSVPQDKPADKKHRLPAGWIPTRSESLLAAESEAKRRGVNLEVELKKLTDWAASNAAKKADWDATWRNWIRNARPDHRQPAHQPSLRISSADDEPELSGFHLAAGIAEKAAG